MRSEAKKKAYSFTQDERAWQQFFVDKDVEALVAATVPEGNEFLAQNIRAAAKIALGVKDKS